MSIGLPTSTSQDGRLLEHNSPRKVFVWLLLLMFLLGANAALTIYQTMRLRRFDWSDGTVLPLLGFLVLRLARTIYRQLDGKTAAQVSERDGDVSTTLRLTRGSGVDVL